MASTTHDVSAPAVATREHTHAPQPYSNPYLAGIGLGLVLLAAFVFVPDPFTRTRQTAREISAGISLQLRVAVESELSGEAHDGGATGAHPAREIRDRAKGE